MQMYILDGKAFAALQESGQHNCEAAVDECMLLANNQVIFAMSSQPHTPCEAHFSEDIYVCTRACEEPCLVTGGWPILNCLRMGHPPIIRQGSKYARLHT